MSCLPTAALSHFEQREQELLALNSELEQKKAQALAEASSAVREAETSSLRPPSGYRPPAIPDDGANPWGVDTAPRRKPSLESPGVGPTLSSPLDRPGSGQAVASSSPPLSRPLTGVGAASAAEGGEALHTTIRYQNSRIIALQEELDKARAEVSNRDAEIHQLKADKKRLADENQKLQDALGPATKQQEKMTKQLSGAESKVHELEQDRAELLKVKLEFDIQQRKFEAEKSTKQSRIDRLTEECDKLKAQLKEASSQDRDRTTTDKKELERLTSEVRKLERQRAELVNAFKKQMKLIDVLKRQRAHMEAARVLSFTEDEFIRVLELGDKLDE